MESDIGGASWKSRHGMRHENRERVASWKGVTEINIRLASRKRRHGKRHLNSEVRSVMERRHGK